MANSLAMITKLLLMSINEIMMLLCQNMLLKKLNRLEINRDNNGFKLLIKESILISRDSPVLNKNTASIPVLLFD